MKRRRCLKVRPGWAMSDEWDRPDRLKAKKPETSSPPHQEGEIKKKRRRL